MKRPNTPKPKAPSTPNPPASGDREEPKKLDPKQGHLVKAWNKRMGGSFA